MKRDAYGRLESNEYPLLHQVGPVEPSTPWAIRLTNAAGRYRLLCFDFDGKDAHGPSPELTEQAVDDCDQLSHLLDEHQVDHVVCESSSSGGRHLWIALAGDGASAADVAALARAARAVLRTLDHGMLCNPAEGSARPPLAPHRDGSSSRVLRGGTQTLTSPRTDAAALAAVTRAFVELRPATRAYETIPAGTVDAGHRAHRALSRAGEAHMATQAGGANPSWTGFMCLLSAAVAGWDITDVRRASKTAPGMEHYRTKNSGRGTRRPRSSDEAEARLDRQWQRAQQYAALYDRLPAKSEPQDLSALDTVVEAVETTLQRVKATPGRWRSEAGQSRQSILRAIAYLTLQTGKPVVAASIRDLALMTGLGRTTAADALWALVNANLLEHVTTADAGNASEWRLASRLSTADGTVRSQPLNNPRPPDELFGRRAVLVSTLEHDLGDIRHDLFTRAGIGHLAGRVYAQLRNGASTTVDQAARELGITTRHAATILSRLRRHRLIIAAGTAWTQSRRDLRNAAARTLGVAGYLERRAERYAAERETWAWWQAETVTMATKPQQRPRRPHASSRPLFVDTAAPGERVWPRYPRSADRRGDHRAARDLILQGALRPEARWQYLGDAA